MPLGLSVNVHVTNSWRHFHVCVDSQCTCVSMVVTVQHALKELGSNILRYQNINVLCVCACLQVIITDASWPQREAFLSALTRCLDSMYYRAQWYPGSEQRRAAFQAQFPQAQVLGRPIPEGAPQPKGHLPAQPWLLIPGQQECTLEMHGP